MAGKLVAIALCRLRTPLTEINVKQRRRDDMSCCRSAHQASSSPSLRAPHALQVDRIETEIMELVPGVRYVDLETDRGRFSTYTRQSIDDIRIDTFRSSPDSDRSTTAA